MNTTDEGFSFSFHKNYKLGPTYPRHAIFSLRELQQTRPSALRAETSSRYQSDPPENQIWHTDEAGASLACSQSTLISGTSFFSEVQTKICKGSLQAPFPLPLVASPLARAFSRDLFHSPKQESLLAGIVVHAHKSRTRKETRAIERGGQRKRSVLEARINLQKKKDRVLIKDLIQGQPTSSFGKYLFGRRFET